MLVRRLISSDAKEYAAPLSELGAATFSQTFAHLYSAQDLQYFLDTTHSVERYKQTLMREDQPIWVVENENKLLAYIKLCPNSLPCRPPLPKAIELSKLYALPENQNLGLGTKLMDAAIDYARDNGFEDMVLSVFSENHDGIRFYARHGFEKIGEYLFPVGEQLDKEFILRKKL